MSFDTLAYSGQLTVLTCWCGMRHAVPAELRNQQLRQHNDGRRPVDIYCPLGHTHGPASEPEAEKLRKRLERERARRTHAEDVLPDLADPVDLVVTDPPYGQDYNSNRGSLGGIEGDDGTTDTPAVLAEACRLLRRGRHAYVFGPPELVAAPLTAAVELIWDKNMTGMGDLTLPWSESHERITFAVYEPSKANRKKGYGRLAARIRQGSVLRHPRVSNGAGARRHPNEKPVDLLRCLIESSSLIGETVLDPYAGSASTLVAARLEGRKSIGVEVDEKWLPAAVDRLKELNDAPVTLWEDA